MVHGRKDLGLVDQEELEMKVGIVSQRGLWIGSEIGLGGRWGW